MPRSIPAWALVVAGAQPGTAPVGPHERLADQVSRERLTEDRHRVMTFQDPSEQSRRECVPSPDGVRHVDRWRPSLDNEAVEQHARAVGTTSHAN